MECKPSMFIGTYMRDGSVLRWIYYSNCAAFISMYANTVIKLNHTFIRWIVGKGFASKMDRTRNLFEGYIPYAPHFSFCLLLRLRQRWTEQGISLRDTYLMLLISVSVFCFESSAFSDWFENILLLLPGKSIVY
jgi:hypothetical protein